MIRHPRLPLDLDVGLAGDIPRDDGEEDHGAHEENGFHCTLYGRSSEWNSFRAECINTF